MKKIIEYYVESKLDGLDSFIESDQDSLTIIVKAIQDYGLPYVVDSNAIYRKIAWKRKKNLEAVALGYLRRQEIITELQKISPAIAELASKFSSLDDLENIYKRIKKN